MDINKIFFLVISAILLVIVVSGCRRSGLVSIDPGLNPDDAPRNDSESVVHDLTQIVTIGDDVSVAVYHCNTDTDCNRCQDGDVYGQTCIDGTCQGTLVLIEECEDYCSVGECIEDDESTTDEDQGAIGVDSEPSDDENTVGANEDPVTDETPCPTGIEKCPGYTRGIGSVYLTKYPECKCEYIYIPYGCNPHEPPCPDYSPRTAYPDCACKD